jgi:hypothetical protein
VSLFTLILKFLVTRLSLCDKKNYKNKKIKTQK